MQPSVRHHHADDNYLEDGLVVPVGVDLAQLARDPVVLPHKQGVKHRQHLKVIFNLIHLKVMDLLKYFSSTRKNG